MVEDAETGRGEWSPWPRLVERSLPESDAVLWAVVLLASGFDVVTTVVGVARGFPEGNAVARAFLETYGTPGIGLLKFVALVVVVVLWAVLPDRYGTTILQAVAVVWVLVVGANAVTLAG